MEKWGEEERLTSPRKGENKARQMRETLVPGFQTILWDSGPLSGAVFLSCGLRHTYRLKLSSVVCGKSPTQNCILFDQERRNFQRDWCYSILLFKFWKKCFQSFPLAIFTHAPTGPRTVYVWWYLPTRAKMGDEEAESRRPHPQKLL